MTSNRAGARGRRDGARDVLQPLSHAIEVLTGREVDDRVLAGFGRYLDLLVLWNRTHRLTGVTSSPAIVRDLFVDSLLFLPLLPSDSSKIVDIGAGAGIPGVPICMVRPRTSMTLVEAKRKPVSFLRALSRELEVGDRFRIAEGRAETLLSDTDMLGFADAVVTRNVGDFDRLIPTALALLKPGGLFIASGPPPGTEHRSPTPAGFSWIVRDYPKLGLKRKFLVGARKS